VTIDELCDLVNAKLEDDAVVPSDSRATSIVTPRIVRYYRTLGLMSAPTRVGGRSDYNSSHIDEVLRIKRAQANGTSLSELKRASEISGMIERQEKAVIRSRANPVASFLPSFVYNFSRPGESDMLDPVHSVTGQVEAGNVGQRFGWSVRIGGVTLSGEGARPTSDQLQRITEVLRDD
jgi:DNA-binding transcriptional MerR regulator